MTILYKYLPYSILLFNAIVLHDFSNEVGQNMLTLAIMGFCVALLPFRLHKLEMMDLIIPIIALILFASYYLHPISFRVSTVMYSCMFFCQLLVFKSLLRYMELKDYMNFIRFLVFAYFVVLVVQQSCTIAGLSWSFNRNGHFEQIFKVNSLAQEPSAVPTNITILMFCWVKMQELVHGRGLSFVEQIRIDKRLWIVAILTIFGCGTTSTIFILPVFLIYFYRNSILKQLMRIIILGFLIFYLLKLVFPYVIERFEAIIEVLFLFDTAELYAADPSASARIAPFIMLIENMDLQRWELWLGHGVDAGIKLFSFILVGEECDRSIGIGGMQNWIYDYGLIAFILLLVYMRKYVWKSFVSYEFFLWLTVFFVYDLNCVGGWLLPLYVMTNNHFKNMQFKL